MADFVSHHQVRMLYPSPFRLLGSHLIFLILFQTLGRNILFVMHTGIYWAIIFRLYQAFKNSREDIFVYSNLPFHFELFYSDNGHGDIEILLFSSD